MSISLKRFTTRAAGKINVNSLIESLDTQGYHPVISKAKRAYREEFKRSGLISDTDFDEHSGLPSRPSMLDRRLLYGEYHRFVLSGDFIFNKNGPGIFYFLVMLTEEDLIRRRHDDDHNISYLVEVGYVGEEEVDHSLEDFLSHIDSALFQDDIEIDWNTVKYHNDMFSGLREGDDTSFSHAEDVTDEDIELSSILSNHKVRALGIKIRRGGGLLRSTIDEGDEYLDDDTHVKQLVDAGLLSTEYVVICKKTSNQVNRLPTKDALAKLASLNVLCSCGRPIEQEINEELYVPSEKLQTLLNQSHWMTVKLVESLRSIGISDDKILLNVLEGSDEVDAFVDLDGTLIMIELKDSEFSMGHAYAFGGRIAQYKPSHAMIVATRGVDSEVKSYFERVEPEAKLIYVDALSELDTALLDVADEIRSEKASEILLSLESSSSVNVPISKAAGERLKIKISKEASRGSRAFYRSQ